MLNRTPPPKKDLDWFALPNEMDTMAFLFAMYLLFSLSVVGAWDIAAGLGWVAGPTVSALIRDWAIKWPMLPFAIGFLIGHLFAT
jgi:hypothetical protein